jgi:hypothetical protein
MQRVADKGDVDTDGADMHATRRTTTLLASTLLGLHMLGMQGCEAPTSDDDDDTQLRASNEVCPARRQIARKPVGMAVCPTVTGWTKGLLFPGAPAGSDLSSFCRYTTPGVPTSTQLAALDGVGLLEHDADCDVLFEQADALSTALAPTMRTLFREAIGHADASDLDLPASAASRARVRVAVIDSWPDAGSVPRSKHGSTMAQIIGDIACPESSVPYACSVDLQGHLALPRYGASQIDLVHGGFYGSQTELAIAIHAAVNAWSADVLANGPSKLILNLSIGWDPTYGDLGDSAAVDAVHVALQYASCKGAIIVASAGNEDQSCSVGPLLPGGWELQAAPSTGLECHEIGAGGLTPHGGGYRPLVYSVGGLRYEDQVMPGSRPDGMPRLAASSTHAVVGDVAPTTALTGTSVSSAVVAGTAALLWSWNPSLRADQVMSMIYAAGEPVQLIADYAGPGVGNTVVHRVDVCSAIDLACSGVPGCSLPLDCLIASPTVDHGDLFLEVEALTPDSTLTPVFGPVVACPSDCVGNPRRSYKVAAVSHACPAAPAPELAFTEPQPTQPACPNCTIKKSGGIVMASVDAVYAGMSVTAVDVTVDDGSTQTLYRLGAVSLSSTTITEIQLSPAPTSIRSASISIQFSALARPQINPLIVE